MEDFKTVEASAQLDPLYAKQREDVANMRTSLLMCNIDPSLTQKAMKNITVMRVYHQIARIIKYTEMMDKIESKMYESIDYQLDNMDPARPTTWMTLLNIQERLQKTMIDSMKLIQPYLDLTEYTTIEAPSSEPRDTVTLDANSRERLRSSAQQVLLQLNNSGGDEDD